MIRILLAIAFYLIPFIGLSQQYKSRADRMYRSERFRSAAKFYIKQAVHADFNRVRYVAYYNAAACYARIGNSKKAFRYLNMALHHGWINKEVLLKDRDFISLYIHKEWKRIVNTMKDTTFWTSDPLQAPLITVDLDNFATAYDLAEKDHRRRTSLIKKYYTDKGSRGMNYLFARSTPILDTFIAEMKRKPLYYASVRNNLKLAKAQGPAIRKSFVQLKEWFPKAIFPSVTLSIGAFNQGGTISPEGLLIGTEMYLKTPDVPTKELTLWEKNHSCSPSELPHIVSHELIHYQQDSMADDTTLLCYVIKEGMAEFIGELISGATINEPIHLWAKGKEQEIWSRFKRDMHFDRYHKWLTNSSMERPGFPADQGYWVGYIICKAYFEKAIDKKQAIHDMLHIKDYQTFYEKSGVEDLIYGKKYIASAEK